MLREWWFNTRYKKYKEVTIDSVTFKFYWKLKKTFVSKGIVYTSIRNYSDNPRTLLTTNIKSYREAFALRIKKKR